MEGKDRACKPPLVSAEDKALSEAIHRIYQKYGADLPAFFRDVYEELRLDRQESAQAHTGTERDRV